MTREREYGIDALRIVSMWMVVILHVLGQGGVLAHLGWPSFRYTVGWFLEAAAYGAVNCYGLISGYVGVRSKPKYSSILYLWIQVVFYSVTLTIISRMIWPKMVPEGEWIRGFFPVNFKFYWYYTAYFFISFLLPVFNKIMLTANKNELVASVGAVTILLSLNHMVFGADMFGAANGYSTLWLALLYMMGGCIRLHGDGLKSYAWICRHWLCVFLLGTIVACAPKIALGNEKISSILDLKVSNQVLMSYISPAIIVSSFALFAFFSKWRPTENVKKWIAWISPATFGVYLIHVHPMIWKLCMKDAFISFAHVKAYVLPVAVIGTAIAIFAGCIVIDLLRIRLFRILRVREGCQWIFKRIGLS